jgi:hypothetical protein
LDEAKREAMMSSNAAVQVEDKPPRYSYLDYYVLDPLDGCFSEYMLIDFTTITAFTKDMVSKVKALKQAELDHDHRVELRRKLAFFLGRDANDVPDERKFTPTVRQSPGTADPATRFSRGS